MKNEVYMWSFCNLVPFLLFKNCEKQPYQNELKTTLPKRNNPPWVFQRYLNCINGIKSRKASHIYITIKKVRIFDTVKVFLKEDITGS